MEPHRAGRDDRYPAVALSVFRRASRYHTAQPALTKPHRTPRRKHNRSSSARKSRTRHTAAGECNLAADSVSGPKVASSARIRRRVRKLVTNESLHHAVRYEPGHHWRHASVRGGVQYSRGQPFDYPKLNSELRRPYPSRGRPVARC